MAKEGETEDNLILINAQIRMKPGKDHVKNVERKRGGGPLHVLNEIKTAGISSRTHEIIIDILDGYKDN